MICQNSTRLRLLYQMPLCMPITFWQWKMDPTLNSMLNLNTEPITFIPHSSWNEDILLCNLNKHILVFKMFSRWRRWGNRGCWGSWGCCSSSGIVCTMLRIESSSPIIHAFLWSPAKLHQSCTCVGIVCTMLRIKSSSPIIHAFASTLRRSFTFHVNEKVRWEWMRIDENASNTAKYIDSIKISF